MPGKGFDTIIAKDITLKQLYNDHVKPGEILYICSAVTKSMSGNIERMKQEDVPLNNKDYALVKAHSTPAHIDVVKPKYTKHDHSEIRTLNTLKCFSLMLSSPIMYLSQTFDKAYRFIEAGYPVEFIVRYAGAPSNKKEQLQYGPRDTWPYIHEHFPHLRPDFILRAMPQGTRFLIDPVSNGRVVQFVLSLRTEVDKRSLTKRLFKVKSAVLHSIESGRQPELPMAVRFARKDEGNDKYPLKPGAPRANVKTKEKRADLDAARNKQPRDALHRVDATNNALRNTVSS